MPKNRQAVGNMAMYDMFVACSIINFLNINQFSLYPDGMNGAYQYLWYLPVCFKWPESCSLQGILTDEIHMPAPNI
jgi:hypothetical protein